jgi:UrcA family protein
MTAISLKAQQGLLTAAAFGALLFGSSAGAQDYYSDTAYNDRNTETVIVTAPREYIPRGHLGGEIVNASASKEVRFDDLDLRSAWGARELENRVKFSARALCDQLDVRYPIAVGDHQHCYRNAVADALAQADQAIAEARD